MPKDKTLSSLYGDTNLYDADGNAVHGHLEAGEDGVVRFVKDDPDRPCAGEQPVAH